MFKLLSQNFRWKMLALLIAIFLWIYINNEVPHRQRFHGHLPINSLLEEGNWP